MCALTKANTLSAGVAALTPGFPRCRCAPCRAVAPVFAALCARHSHLLFARLDVDEMEECATELRITTMPTFCVFRHGKRVETLSGAERAPLMALVERAVARLETPKAEPRGARFMQS